MKLEKEEEEIQKQYKNIKKIPLQVFNQKYTQQMEEYQKSFKRREEIRDELEFNQCTFTPTTNHTSKAHKKQLNKDLRDVGRASTVVERMEEFQKNKNFKIEKRKRDLTPNFKPRVLDNYNSRRKA